MDSVLRAENITKRFGRVVAIENVSVAIKKGEIHCLLGENGAGKSTFAECLYGYYQPDSGKIYLDNQLININSPNDAIRNGIGMVHQHFVLAPPMSVIENVIVGLSSQKAILDLKTAREKLEQLCADYCLSLDLNAKIWQLSVGEQQWVEILKALYIDSKILILDEPTAVLTPQETEKFFNALKQMRESGISVILITHKLDEVMEIADRVTLLKKGKYIDTVETSSVSREQLAKMMVGREVIFSVQREDIAQGEPVLEIKGLSALNDRGLPALHNVSLTVHQNEILGIAGVAGNGQKELLEVISGLRTAQKGEIVLNGKTITNEKVINVMKAGVGHIPEDRIEEGLIPDFSIAENLILGQQRSKRFKRGIFLNREAIKENAEQAVSSFKIATPSIDHTTKMLSGGNLQKVILSREFQICENCLLANQPTRGLDVGVIEYVHSLLMKKRGQGIGIILVSEDLDEILSLSDRIAVICGGEIIAVFQAKDAQIEDIGVCMAGIGGKCNDK